MEISSPHRGWAEQNPLDWWDHVKKCCHKLQAAAEREWEAVSAIGLSYQMHGLVIVDANGEVLRPSIIWCDSRAVDIGKQATQSIGLERCLHELLNDPGNFTASKLKWVKDHEPEVYKKIYKMMLPGDYIALKMTGEFRTTPSGLSEGILWNYREEKPSRLILEEYDLSEQLLPEIVPPFSIQGELHAKAAEELKLHKGIPVAYRAGDQPNNAFSLNVLNPGEVATTAGTSGVVYGVSNQPNFDPHYRVNTFLHVNHTVEAPRLGVLFCLNGTGILYRWLKQEMLGELSYSAMNELAASAPVGSDGLLILPFGNGAERVLKNNNIGASIHNLNFNVHQRPHILRAALESIAFALNYGIEVMREMGIEVNTVRAGNSNLFLSPLFRSVFSTVTGTRVELYNTDGSQGAARGAGLGVKLYASYKEAFTGLQCIECIEPDSSVSSSYSDVYHRWKDTLSLVWCANDPIHFLDSD